MFACIIARKQETRSGFYRRVLEERDRIQIVQHHGLLCWAIRMRHHEQREAGDLTTWFVDAGDRCRYNSSELSCDSFLTSLLPRPPLPPSTPRRTLKIS